MAEFGRRVAVSDLLRLPGQPLSEGNQRRAVDGLSGPDQVIAADALSGVFRGQHQLAAFQVGLGKKGRQERDAQSMNCRLRHGRKLVEYHAVGWRRIDPQRRQPARPSLGPGFQMQQGLVKNVAWLPEPRGKQIGRANRDDGFRHQRQVFHIRPVLPAKMDGSVKRAVVKGKGAQPGAEVDSDFRVGLGKIPQPWRKPMHPERGQNSEVQRAARRIGAHRNRSLRQAVQDTPDLIDIGLTGIGQCQPAPLPRNQGHIELLFQRLELAADRTLRQRQFLSRLGCTAKARHRLKREQGKDNSRAAPVALPNRATASNASRAEMDGRKRRGAII